MQNVCFAEVLQIQVVEIFVMYISVYSHNLHACFLHFYFCMKFLNVCMTEFIVSSVTLSRCDMWYNLFKAESDYSAYHN